MYSLNRNTATPTPVNPHSARQPVSHETKYIFVTGGVISSLGKGIASAAIGTLLANTGLSITMMKLDPYINVDPGTMSPYQHGEVFVTSDGAETDLDLGHYERYLNIQLSKTNNCTSGSVYSSVINRERQGGYLGNTVQVVPHITDEIKRRIRAAAAGYELIIVEIGGTVGDIESLPFLEAVRQLRIELGLQNTVSIHLTLVPYMSSSQEFKTKPTQRSVRELCGLGIQPDFIMCRSVDPLPEAIRDKIALFTNSTTEAVLSLSDVDNVYIIPLLLNQQRMGQKILQRLGLPVPEQILLPDWERINNLTKRLFSKVKVALVGKYTAYSDAYKSINEALHHAGWQLGAQVEIVYYAAGQLLGDPEPESERKQGMEVGNATGDVSDGVISSSDHDLRHEPSQPIEDADYTSADTNARLAQLFADVDAILIPGGFGARGTEGMIAIIGYARTRGIPCFGICFGMQLMVVEFARAVAGWQDANSAELDPQTTHPVVMWSEQRIQGATADIKNERMGGSMRLGSQPCSILAGSILARCYCNAQCHERYRHRYEVNNQWLPELERLGLLVSGRSAEHLAMVVELPGHPWFLGCQFHPEFTSNPRVGHPLFNDFITAANNFRRQREEKV